MRGLQVGRVEIARGSSFRFRLLLLFFFPFCFLLASLLYFLCRKDEPSFARGDSVDRG